MYYCAGHVQALGAPYCYWHEIWYTYSGGSATASTRYEVVNKNKDAATRSIVSMSNDHASTFRNWAITRNTTDRFLNVSNVYGIGSMILNKSGSFQDIAYGDMNAQTISTQQDMVL